ncbi:MAG: hypothetical protein NWE92_12990 [Candidatus Bathyarchaeota archaeon]|nr:hypothetical protein [Candidatus Bathyarchaeota archaeon]
MSRIVLLLFILLLFTACAAPILVGKANPTPDEKMIAPPSGVIIEFTVDSPNGDVVYENGTINLCLKAALYGPEKVSQSIYRTTYKGDWMQNPKQCPVKSTSIMQPTWLTQIDFNITDIPFGEHVLEITSYGKGGYWLRGQFTSQNKLWGEYTLAKNITVTFTTHAKPIITFATPQNVTSASRSFPLNFSVDHMVSEITYCLDGQNTVLIAENTTLTGLANGQHNVTITAKDAYGYTGTSEPLIFNVEADALSPVMLYFLVALGVAVGSIIVAVGVLFFLRKQRN